MHSYVTTLTCLFFLFSTVSALGNSYPKSTASVGMGNITTLRDDVWSALMNPAGLGLLQGAAAGIQHEQRFAMLNLGMDVVAAGLPVLGGGLGIYFSNLGYAGYGENQAGLSIGRKLSSNFSVGGGVHIHLLRFPDQYRNATAISGNVGVYATLTKQWNMGVYVTNISFSHFNNEHADKLPVVFQWGMGYQATENILLCAEVEKDVAMPLRAKAGAECFIIKTLSLRAGVLSAPFEVHGGLGFIHRKLHIDFAVRYHPVLGVSPQAGVSIDW